MSAGELRYVVGDATAPDCAFDVDANNKLIIHCCNNFGKWGAGFVLALSKRWSQPEKEYLKWFYFKHKPFKLGEIQAVQVKDNLTVVNMIGQHGLYTDRFGVPPIRYEAISECLEKVAKLAIDKKASVHACRFGAGLASGTWGKIEELIIEKLINNGINVTVYDLEIK